MSEEGTDVSEINAGGLIDVPVEHEGKTYMFKFQEMTWDERNKLLVECEKQKGNEIEQTLFFVDKICVRYLRECPDGFDYKKVKPEFGDKFAKAVANTMALATKDISEDELKNLKRV